MSRNFCAMTCGGKPDPASLIVVLVVVVLVVAVVR